MEIVARILRRFRVKLHRIAASFIRRNVRQLFDMLELQLEFSNAMHVVRIQVSL